jgi:hypothetical protein
MMLRFCQQLRVFRSLRKSNVKRYMQAVSFVRALVVQNPTCCACASAFAPNCRLQQAPGNAAAGSSIGGSRLAAGSGTVGSSNAAKPAGFPGTSTAAAAGTGAAAAAVAAAASSPAAEEDGFELRSRLGDDSERQLLYEDVLQRLPWEEVEDDDTTECGDSMQEQLCTVLSRRWGSQQPRQQQQYRQRLFGDAGLGLQRPGAEQLLGGGVSEGSLEWYEAQLLEVSVTLQGQLCKRLTQKGRNSSCWVAVLAKGLWSGKRRSCWS